IHVTIDQHPVVLGTDRDTETALTLSTSLSNYRASSPVFAFTLPTENIRQGTDCPITGSVSAAVTEGWAVMLPPLVDGEHTIRFGATYGEPTNFTFDVENHVNAVRVNE